MIDLSLAAKLFAALFAIMGPLSTVPIFLALTEDLDAAGRRSALLALLATVSIGALVCALAGNWVLALFGIDVAHFRLAGGLLVLLIALSMLNGEEHASHKGTPGEQTQYRAADNPGIYPLGLPLSLGPGTMATIIVYADSARSRAEVAGFYTGLAVYLAFFAAVMLLAPWLGTRLSPTVLSVAKRLMGIVLAAIAMEMIGDALGVIFPGWLH
ncbi:MarC family protein [Ancylobacter sp. 6x-1]|uniref:UPF0056 membrane protein n=1 Tax=Ancylobacter crimeensis TaxID=2579147 RepID=A0ABT0DDI5_9HYPH|nr:MarC family protein [Ancylobacter crimeensis]MCK0197929.1 MarC family protein [Ancylobacter crimeensis]